MSAIRRLVFAVALLCAAATRLQAQIGEVQLGLVAGYGPGQSQGPTGGLVVGVAAGRLSYIGLRATRHVESRVEPGSGTSNDVSERAGVLAADAAMIIPAGPLELMLGLTIGAVRYDQTVTPQAGGGGVKRIDSELLVAPGFAAELHVGPLAVIPELRYQFTGYTEELTYPARRTGLLVSLRVVVPLEVGRIRT